MEKITRREFFKIGATGVLAACLPKALRAAEPEETAKPVIAVASGNQDKLVQAAVDALGGIGNFVKEGDKVLIKPNISFAANAECGATTSVGIAKQVVQICLDAGADKVVIIDYPLQNEALCVEMSGIKNAITDPRRVSLLMLGKERQFTEIPVPRGKVLKNTKIAKELQKFDKLINLPVAKSHSATGVSIGLKNLMGLIWDRSLFHRVNIYQAIADLATVIKPDLTIVDATRVLSEGGPGGPGKTVVPGKVIAGTDVVAVDSYGVTVAPWYNKAFKGTSVKYIVYAAELGLGEIDTAKMTIREVKA
jgi:uncharacterized protein (DUF362 family)